MRKKLILGGLTVVFSILFWWVVENSVYNIQLKSFSFWIKNVIALGLYSGFLVNFLAVAEDPHDKRHSPRLVLLIFVLQAILYILFFGLNRFFLLAAVIFVLVGLSYHKAIEKEKHESITISFSRIINKQLGYFILAMALVLSAGYFFSPKVQEKNKKFEVPLTYRNLVLNFSQEILLLSAPPEVKEQLKDPKVRQQIEAEIKNSSNQTFSALENYLKPYLEFMPILLSLGFFLSLLAFTFIWRWTILLFGSAVFIILKRTGFISIKKIVIEKEEINV